MLMDKSTVFVIIPCYNEDAGVVRQTVLPLLAEAYTVVLVDDGSNRDFFPQLSDLPLVYLRHAANLGQGAALQTGMEYARRQGAACVVHFDADGQHAAGELDALLEPLRRGVADVVLGSRFLRREDEQRVPALRRWVLRVARTVNGLFTGMWLTDAHNGLRALNRPALEAIYLSENRQAHATEILYQIRRNRLRTIEVPSSIVYTPYSRAKGQSSMNAFSVLIDLILNKLFR
jgi:glycosyltransferase involved in cell wall biosynthesis